MRELQTTEARERHGISSGWSSRYSQTEKSLTFEHLLPYPPSVNTYWRHPSKGPLAGRHLISEKGREYRSQVMAAIGQVEPMKGRLSIGIIAYAPDKRRRDLDNILKSLLDAITAAGVVEDDSQFDVIKIVRGEQMDGGAIFIKIQQE
jgi:crossover junction endodeoxyribonuclease RusA